MDAQCIKQPRNYKHNFAFPFFTRLTTCTCTHFFLDGIVMSRIGWLQKSNSRLYRRTQTQLELGFRKPVRRKRDASFSQQ